MSIPSDASSANCDSTADDPKLALTVDLKNLIDSYNSLLADLRTRNLDAPTGTVAAFAGASAPTNWLLCDGSAVSRTTYAALFAVIGTTYGAGDGTTFNLPDLRGRAPFGKDNMGGTAASRLVANVSGGITAADGQTIGKSGGEATHLLTGAESGEQGHSHPATTSVTTTVTTTISGGATLPRSNGSSGVIPVYPGKIDTTTAVVNDTLALNATASSSASSSASTTITAAGAANASASHNNLPPLIVLNYIIKT